MSNERSPLDVCSMTIGTSVLSNISIELLATILFSLSLAD